MQTRPDVIQELRGLFKQGATPSRLFRHIAEQHAGDSDLFLLVQLYFIEGFGVGIVRGLNRSDDHQHHDDLRYAFQNNHLLHEMIEKKGDWDTDGKPSWLDSLTATDVHERLRLAEADTPKPRYWGLLTPEEQRYLMVNWSSAAGLSETVKILCRLCENLQQQVNELSAAPANQ